MQINVEKNAFLPHSEAMTRLRSTAGGGGRRKGVGDLDAGVEERTIGHQRTALTVRDHDRRQDTLQRKTVACVGKHDQTDGITPVRRVAGEAVIDIHADHDRRTEFA